jgi:glucose-1-phosphate cytidylyltransferase
LKAVILAGGRGTRLSEETVSRPKPMIDIGGRPLIWHVMKSFECYGVTEFVICCGYKGYMIKEYFANYFLRNSDATFDLKNNAVEIHSSSTEPWRVTLTDTGESTMTGGRLRRARAYLDGEDFFFTYGDGVSDVDIDALVDCHKRNGRLATVTAVRPPARFGALRVDGERAVGFREKPVGDGGWINGGYFVLSPAVIDYIEGDATVWEQEPLAALTAAGQLSVYCHEGMWQTVDTLRDKEQLISMWGSGQLPWKIRPV